MHTFYVINDVSEIEAYLLELVVNVKVLFTEKCASGGWLETLAYFILQLSIKEYDISYVQFVQLTVNDSLIVSNVPFWAVLFTERCA